MFPKAKRIIKYASMSAFMLFNSNLISGKAHDNLFSTSFSTSENIHHFESKNNENENIKHAYLFEINEPFHTIRKRVQQRRLIEKAINSTSLHSVDSVIKFVDKNLLKEYFTKNNISADYEKDEINLNRLRALIRDGNEIFFERMNIIRNYTDEHLSNEMRREKSLEKLAEYMGTKPGQAEYNPYNTEHFFRLYQEDIEHAAIENRIRPKVLAGLIKHESGGFSFAISKTGAIGPGQLTSYIYSPNSYWRNEMKDINPFNTPEAIYRSAEFLSHLIKKYQMYDDDEHTLALSAYNQGPRRIDRAISIAMLNGIRKPKEIINFINGETEQEFTQIYFLSEEGRRFSERVQKEIKNVNLHFTSLEVNGLEKKNPEKNKYELKKHKRFFIDTDLIHELVDMHGSNNYFQNETIDGLKIKLRPNSYLAQNEKAQNQKEVNKKLNQYVNTGVDLKSPKDPLIIRKTGNSEFSAQYMNSFKDDCFTNIIAKVSSSYSYPIKNVADTLASYVTDSTELISPHKRTWRSRISNLETAITNNNFTGEDRKALLKIQDALSKNSYLMNKKSDLYAKAVSLIDFAINKAS
jgi:hypothetical protein